MKDIQHQSDLYTIAFYNLENLFDTIDDPDTLDDDFTPEGKKKWNSKKYKRKIKKMGSVIAQIGTAQSGFPPAIIGLAEVENRKVIEDMVTSENLKKFDYGIVHFDSPDERGIEVALLYRKKIFNLTEAKTFTLLISNDEGERDYTRDVLMVKGELQGEQVHFIVNHWPSRRAGENETEYKRIAAANLVHQIIDKIKSASNDATILVMGDFNDDPTSNSIKQHLVNGELHNPFESILAKGHGSLNHKGQWHLFDQIIVSKNLLNNHNLVFDNAYIFDEYFLKEWKGKYKGNPFRTYIGKWHQGGFSDHFPVFITLEKY